MQRWLVGILLLSLVAMAGCISTSSEPPIRSSRLVPSTVPDPSVDTVAQDATEEPADVVVTQEPQESTTAEPTEATTALPTEIATEAPQVAIPDTFSVEGIIRNATTNDVVTDELDVSAILYDDPSGEPVEIYNEVFTARPDGTFTFTDITTDVDTALMVISVVYQGVTSPYFFLVPNEVTGPVQEVDLFVYEVTDDRSALAFTTVNTFFDASPNENAGVVLQTIEINNSGNQLIYDGQYSFTIPIPDNALNPRVQIPPMMAATLTDDSFVLEQSGASRVFQVTIPFAPGRLFFSLIYDVQYTDDITISQEFAYPVADMVLWVPPQREFAVSSEQLSTDADRSRDGDDYIGYSVTDEIVADDTLSFTISGGIILPDDPSPQDQQQSTTTTSSDDADSTDNTGIIVVGIGILLLVSGVLYLIYDLQKTRIKMGAQVSTDANGTTRDKLLDAIAALDEQFEQGEIAEEDYQKRRRILKEQLRDYFE